MADDEDGLSIRDLPGATNRQWLSPDDGTVKLNDRIICAISRGEASGNHALAFINIVACELDVCSGGVVHPKAEDEANSRQIRIALHAMARGRDHVRGN